MEQRSEHQPSSAVREPVSASEARFRAVVDGFGDPILILDGYEIIRYVNAEFLRVFGYASADVIGKPFDELVPEDERPLIVAALANRLPVSQGLLRLEHHLLAHDARRAAVETSANPLTDPLGMQTTILHLRVITERKRAEETLRASEERYRQLIENSHDLIQSVARDGRVLFANRAWLETLGYTETDLARLTIWDVIAPISREACEQSFAALWQGQNVDIVRATLRTRRGGMVDVEGAAVLQTDQERPLALSIFFRDVTEQRQNARIHAARFAVSQILAASPALDIALPHVLQAIAAHLRWQAAELWLPDEQGQSLTCRDGWRTVEHAGLDLFAAASGGMAFNRDQGLPGRAWSTGAVIWEENLAASPTFRRSKLAAVAGLHSAVAVPIMQGPEPVGVMLFFSQDTRPVEASLAALADLGEQLAHFAARKRAEAALEVERAMLARRVIERTADLSRVNEELARAVRAKDEFLANMSHELRTPLNSILGFSEMLLEQLWGALNEKQITSLRHIETSGRHLLMLINDILDLSKVEAGRLDLFIEPVIIADACQVSIIFVRELALKKQIQLSFQLNDQMAVIDADEKRLKQMLINLLSNAVKFTPLGGKVHMQVDVQPERNRVYFSVQDTGIGIAPENLSRLFQPFTQLSSSLQREHEGAGLGLALVRRLTDLHSGSLSVESTPGVGSTFAIALPHRQPGKPGILPSAELTHAAAHRPGAEQRRAIVIDASESSREQLTRYLGSMNFYVVSHPRGAGALEQVLQTQPEVIFLDLLLPNESGWEILAQLKADKRTSTIPVIIVSVVDEQVKGLAAGAAAYIVKPLAREDLRAALRTAVTPGKPNAAAAPPAPPVAAAERGQVLLVDDNESNIQVLGDYLQACGYQLVVAHNGREAIERANDVRPDVILLDIQMPELDGLEVTRRLRTDPSFAATPIITLTALAMPGDRERCLAAGADEYITKPVRMRELEQVIRRLLKR